MIQQLLLWANFLACFLLFSCKPTISGRSRCSHKGGVIFNLGMQVSDFPLFPLMQFKDLMPRHGEILFSFPDWFHLKSLAYLCSVVAPTYAAGIWRDLGQRGVKSLGYRRKSIHPYALPESGMASPPSYFAFCWEFNTDCSMALMPQMRTQAGRLGQERCPSHGPRWDLSRFIHVFVQNMIASSAREEVGARWCVFLAAVFLN